MKLSLNNPPRRSIKVVSTPRSTSISISNNHKQSIDSILDCQQTTFTDNSKISARQTNEQIYQSLQQQLLTTQEDIVNIQIQLEQYKSKNGYLRSQIDGLEAKAKENKYNKALIKEENVFSKSIEKRLNCLMPKKRMALQQKRSKNAN